MKRKKLEHFKTTKMIEGKRSRVKREKKDVHWTNKVAKYRTSERGTERNEG